MKMLLSNVKKASIIVLLFIISATTAKNHDLLRKTAEAGTRKSRATNSNNLRLLSLPLIPHRHHPKYNTIKDSVHDEDGPRRYNRRRQKRFLAETTEEIVVNDEPEFDQLYQGYGTHYVDLWTGTPPQRQTVIVDTGSSTTAFPCSECHDCGSGYHVDGFFQEEDSSTFQKLGCTDCMLGDCSSTYCHMSASYQEGSSWSAYEALDIAYTGGPHDSYLAEGEDTTFPLHFGCQTSITGLFMTQLADGIMGMENEAETYWAQMYDSGAFNGRPKQFSLCYSRQPTADMEGTAAGTMTFGGTDKRLHTTPMVYAKQLNTEGGWYVVKIKNIFLRWHGGQSTLVPEDVSKDDITLAKVPLDVDSLNGNGHVIVDSGTTDTYLASHLARPFNDIWSKVTGSEYDNKSHTLSEEQLLLLPTILIQLEASDEGENDDPESTVGLAGALDPDNPSDIVVSMPPTHYLEYSPSKGKYTSRLYFTESHGGVLGANFIMGHDTMFDMDNNRVGFAESDCDYDYVLEQVEEAAIVDNEGEG